VFDTCSWPVSSAQRDGNLLRSLLIAFAFLHCIRRLHSNGVTGEAILGVDHHIGLSQYGLLNQGHKAPLFHGLNTRPD
jgi:hypothetical protein